MYSMVEPRHAGKEGGMCVVPRSIILYESVRPCIKNFNWSVGHTRCKDEVQMMALMGTKTGVEVGFFLQALMIAGFELHFSPETGRELARHIFPGTPQRTGGAALFVIHLPRM